MTKSLKLKVKSLKLKEDRKMKAENRKSETARIDARGLHYRELNERIHEAIAFGKKKIILENVSGHRYIGCGVKGEMDILVRGVPGNDLAAFMDGPRIRVEGNGEDAIGNTMNAGKVVVNGDAGDVIGYAMRGGKIYIRGDIGYRVGIHMKSYEKQFPVIIVGGSARDFLGEYMAGGLLIVLGIGREERPWSMVHGPRKGINNYGEDYRPIVGDYVGTGMHGGIIYLRGKVEKYQLGKEVSVQKLDRQDEVTLKGYLKEYCQDLGLDLKEILNKKFTKLVPTSSRPYGNIYTY